MVQKLANLTVFMTYFMVSGSLDFLCTSRGSTQNGDCMLINRSTNTADADLVICRDQRH